MSTTANLRLNLAELSATINALENTLDDAFTVATGVALDKALRAYASLNAQTLPAGPVTLWDLIHPSERVRRDRMPFRVSGTDDAEPGRCSGCGAVLATEGDFARHFIIEDRRYLNLGVCPAHLSSCEDHPNAR